MSFELTGLEEIMSKIENMGKNVEVVQNKVVNAQSDILLKEMQANIRVDTGKTRDSLNKSNVMTDSEGRKYKLVGAYKCPRAHIVRFLERGCKRWRGKKYPFIRPSFHKCKARMIGKGKEILQKELFK